MIRNKENLDVSHAIDLIADYYEREFGDRLVNTEDLSKIGLAYTTYCDDKVEVSVEVDLNDYCLLYWVTENDEKTLYNKEEFANLEALTEDVLECMSFDVLVSEFPDFEEDE